MASRIGNALGRLRGVRFVALLVIGIAITLYLAPYVADAGRCLDDAEPPVKECLGEIYAEMRADTNLAAGIIALAVILAAWRPLPDGAE